MRQNGDTIPTAATSGHVPNLPCHWPGNGQAKATLLVSLLYYQVVHCEVYRKYYRRVH